MSLLSFPNELLLLIADSLNQTDTNSLLLTNHRLAQVLTPRLHALALLDRDSWTALQWAASTGSKSLALTVLRHGANIDFLFPESDLDRVHKTALQLAAEAADEPMVSLLLAHGADVSACSPRDYATALHYAVKGGCGDCVVLLLLHGADVSAVDEGGTTPLLWAVGYGFAGIVRILLEGGADVGVVGRGLTPLHWAARRLDEVVIGVLLRHGADTAVRDGVRGWTPLEWAVGVEGGAAAVRVLESAGDG